MATVELSRVNLGKRLVFGIIVSSRKEDQVEAADGISRLMQTRRWLIRTEKKQPLISKPVILFVGNQSFVRAGEKSSGEPLTTSPR